MPPHEQKQGLVERWNTGKCPVSPQRIKEKIVDASYWLKRQIFDRFKSEPDQNTLSLYDMSTQNGKEDSQTNLNNSPASASDLVPTQNPQPASFFQNNVITAAPNIPTADYVAMRMKINDAMQKQASARISMLIVGIETIANLPISQPIQNVVDASPHNNIAPSHLTFDLNYIPALKADESNGKRDIHSFDDDTSKFAPAIPAMLPTKTDNKFDTHTQPIQALITLSSQQLSILTHLSQPTLAPPPQPHCKTFRVPINRMAGLINGYTYMEILTIPWLRKLYGHLIGIFDMEPDITVSQIAFRGKVKTKGSMRPKTRPNPKINNPNVQLKKIAKILSRIKEKVRDRHLPTKFPDLKKSEKFNELKKKIAKEINRLEQLAKKALSNIKKFDHAKRGEITNKLLKRFAREFDHALKRIEKLLEKQIKELSKRQQKNDKRKNDAYIKELKSLVKLLKLLKRKQLIVALLLDNKKNKKNKNLLLLMRALEKLAELDETPT